MCETLWRSEDEPRPAHPGGWVARIPIKAPLLVDHLAGRSSSSCRRFFRIALTNFPLTLFFSNPAPFVSVRSIVNLLLTMCFHLLITSLLGCSGPSSRILRLFRSLRLRYAVLETSMQYTLFFPLSHSLPTRSSLGRTRECLPASLGVLLDASSNFIHTSLASCHAVSRDDHPISPVFVPSVHTRHDLLGYSSWTGLRMEKLVCASSYHHNRRCARLARA